MKPKTNPIANTYLICQKCKNAWIENYVYPYCPECMNEYYKSIGLQPVLWITDENGITIGVKN